MAYYPRDEQETIYSYCPIEREWQVYSTYPPHIKRIIDRADVIDTEVDEVGKIVLITARAEQSQVRVYEERINKPTAINKALVRGINSKAAEKGLIANITKRALEEIWNKFKKGCALTGDRYVNFDHVIPLDIRHRGSEVSNIIPLKDTLNSSKSNHNIFDWFADNRERFGLEQRKFDELIEYLAGINGMTTKEYEEYVRWCHDNPRTIDEIKAEKDDDGASA